MLSIELFAILINIAAGVGDGVLDADLVTLGVIDGVFDIDKLGVLVGVIDGVLVGVGVGPTVDSLNSYTSLSVSIIIYPVPDVTVNDNNSLPFTLHSS